MQTLKARILSVLKLQPYRRKDKSDGQSEDIIIRLWRMRVSYLGPETLYEMELREPLKSFASKKYTVGLNGLVEFEMLAEPHVAAGESILIDAYEAGEKILGMKGKLSVPM
jgi:hypothetical protein